MSSSSDIEKLFDHFGGDANAYQEIGRENEARTARTRWPLLVTLDLTQPTIPEIGQRAEAKPQPTVSAASAVDGQDTAPKDVAAVTRAKAPLFTRSHRRDIPPVAVAVSQPAAPTGASRFGALGADEASPVAAQPVAAAAVPPIAAVAPIAPAAPAAPIAFAAPSAPVAPNASFAGAQFNSPFRTPVMPSAPLPAQVQSAPAAQNFYATSASPASFAPSGWAPAAAPAPAYPSAPAGFAPFMQTAQPMQAQPPAQPTSILGKLFAAPAPAAPQRPSAAAPSSSEAAPLQSVFDRLRGAPAQVHAPTLAAPAGASHAGTPGVPPSWLVNGPRRS